MNYPAQVHSDQGLELHTFGDLSPRVVLLDNRFETVEPYREHLLERGISTLLTSKTGHVREAYSKYENRAAYVFDMHMRRVKQVGSRSTEDGLAVGVAMIADLTEDGTKNQITHCATLTEYAPEDAAKKSYAVLERRGQQIKKLNKNERFDEFVKFIDEYERQYLENYKGEMALSSMSALSRAYEPLARASVWDSDFASMLGYSGARGRVFEEERELVAKTASIDLEDRIQALTYIRKGLFLHFDDDTDAQRAWLDESRPELGGSSAWECLTSGEMDGVVLVANYVNQVIG